VPDPAEPDTDIAAVLAGDDAGGSLARRLDAEPELGDELLAAMRLEGELRAHFADADPERRWDELIRRLSARPRRNATRRIAALAAAACLAIAGVAAWWWYDRPDDLRLIGPDDRERNPVEAGAVRIGAGHRFVDRGATVEVKVSLPSLLEFPAGPDRRLHLISGRLRAAVVPGTGADALTIATPHGEFSVAGTRFTVTCDPTRSVLEVDRGRVAWRCPGWDGEATVGVGGRLDVGRIAGRERGLLAVYHLGTDFDRPRLVRIDPTIDFLWQLGEPVGFPPGTDRFSVEWHGYLVPEEDGEYRFLGTFDDELRVILDGEIVGSWRKPDSTAIPAEATSDPIPLEAGRRHRLQVRFVERAHHGNVRLRWRLGEGEVGPIPSRVLRPAADLPDPPELP